MVSNIILVTVNQINVSAVTNKQNKLNVVETTTTTMLASYV